MSEEETGAERSHFNKTQLMLLLQLATRKRAKIGSLSNGT